MKDTDFIRGNIPMTKEEIRTLVISKLELKPYENFMDIGAGTGSVSIEVALNIPQGKAWAIEHKEEGCYLINKNKEKHNVNNLEIISAKAPEGMTDISEINKIFIGGSGGNLIEILDVIRKKAVNTEVIVITAIILDTMITAYQYFKKHNWNFDLIQVGINKIDTSKNVNMLTAQNPIFILTAKRTK